MQRRTFLKLSAISAAIVTQPGLVGCTPAEIQRSVSAGRNLKQGNVSQALGSQLPSTGIPALDLAVRKELDNLGKKLVKKWGDKKVASPKEYVKYTDDYQSRAIVNFETGIVRVETIDQIDSKTKLEKSIVTTLLTPEDPSNVDLLTDKSIATTGEPFLHPLVLDQQNQPIRYEWRAQQYAKYLIANAYQTEKDKKIIRHFVTFKMTKNHDQNSQQKYASFVVANSSKFKVKQSLIYAIMEAESSFNPYAISHIPAYGLMQIVPASAGRDAHELIYKKPGTPTKDYLFVAKNNIEMGTAYLSILNDRYLAKVKNPQAREYCVIAGYNTGSGNVLKAFNSNREQAFNQINKLSPQQVYNHLVKNLPYDETRRYLQKVTQFQTKYV